MLLRWTLATCIGGAVGGALAGMFPLGGLFVAAVAGVVAVGIAQSLVLRHLVDRKRWALTSAAAGAAGWLAGLIGVVLLSAVLVPAGPIAQGNSSAAIVLRSGVLGGVGGLTAGTIVGYAQRTILRPIAQHAQRWVLASAVGWGAGTAVHMAALVLLEGRAGKLWLSAISQVVGAPASWAVLMTLIWSTGWLISGAVTGGVLARLVAHAQNDKP